MLWGPPTTAPRESDLGLTRRLTLGTPKTADKMCLRGGGDGLGVECPGSARDPLCVRACGVRSVGDQGG